MLPQVALVFPGASLLGALARPQPALSSDRPPACLQLPVATPGPPHLASALNLLISISCCFQKEAYRSHVPSFREENPSIKRLLEEEGEESA